MSETLVHARHLKVIRKTAGVKVPRRRSRIPRQTYPRMIEKDYAEAISEVTGRAAKRTLQPLLDELPSILESARASRADSSDNGIVFAGFNIVIENPRGTIRKWVEADGREGATMMLHDYGYLDGFVGADGEEVDVYLGPDESAPYVYVVHQRKAPNFSEYDEDKVMLGWPSADSARFAYLCQYDDPRFFGGMTMLPVDEFRSQLSKSNGGPITARLDADEGQRVRKLVDKAKQQMSAISSDKIEALGRKFAEQTSTHQRKQLGAQVRAALGVDVVFKDKSLGAKVNHFAAENASLIESMQTNVHNDVAKIVTRAIVNGELNDEVAAKIADRFDVSESHARLIARDQIGKLYGQINASRQRELGIKKFIWRTVGDERVRDEHDQREQDSDPALGGDPYEFDDPPDGELPGVPIQCRCTAEPVFDLGDGEEESSETPDETPADQPASAGESDDEEED